ncbi:MAG: Rrf2 family transcriptional regulator [Oceanipulchritudo sp.]
MFPYGKTAANAVAAMSYLAQSHGDPPRKVNSAEISRERGISKALVAKILTILSQAGLVAGSPGPGGGYYLARDPEKICLFDIIEHFERTDQPVSCPFGPEWCGNKAPCPLHDKILELNRQAEEFLRSNRLSAFSPRAHLEAEMEKTDA